MSAAQVAPRLYGANSIDGHLITSFRHIEDGCRSGEEWIARQVGIVQHNVDGWIANVAQEAIAPIIKRVAKACPAGLQFQLHRPWIKSKIAASRNRFGLRLARRDHAATVARSSHIDLVIQTPDRIVHHSLNVVLAKASEDFLADVRLCCRRRYLSDTTRRAWP